MKSFPRLHTPTVKPHLLCSPTTDIFKWYKPSQISDPTLLKVEHCRMNTTYVTYFTSSTWSLLMMPSRNSIVESPIKLLHGTCPSLPSLPSATLSKVTSYNSFPFPHRPHAGTSSRSLSTLCSTLPGSAKTRIKNCRVMVFSFNFSVLNLLPFLFIARTPSFRP